MKFIDSTYGATVLPVLQEDIYPKHGFVLQELVNVIVETYNFVQFPAASAIASPLAGQKITFTSGGYVTENHAIAINRLDIMPDGMLVTAHSTLDADLILEHLLTVLHRRLGFKKCDFSKMQKLHHGSVVVEFKKSIEAFIKPFNKMREVINDVYNNKIESHILKLVFAPDPLLAQPKIPAQLPVPNEFIIERRIGTPLEQNRYFSSAPLSTEEHIHILERIEKAIA